MKESVNAALSSVSSKTQSWNLSSSVYNVSDIHVHVPSGAIPNDGSSAGVAIVEALASMATKKKVRKEVALTGEVTLSGKVLKIGGVKEKVLAAHRAGVEIVVMPKENEKNLIDVPESVKKDLRFEFVENMDEALKVAFM
jgi:ATP-dependent Lon protease